METDEKVKPNIFEYAIVIMLVIVATVAKLFGMKK